MYHPFTLDCFKSGVYRDEISALLCLMDLGISGIEIVDKKSIEDALSALEKPTLNQDEESVNRDIDNLTLWSEHPIFDSEGRRMGKRVVPMHNVESDGTMKLFALAGPIVDTLKQGRVLFIDEIDAKFHPLMTKELIRLFQSEKTNPKNAQLIFITHDTNLLNKDMFRRDQIWFVEKDSYGGSHLYSLAEFKFEETVNASYKEDYIAGRYGAIPFLGDFASLFNTEKQGDISK